MASVYRIQAALAERQGTPLTSWVVAKLAGLSVAQFNKDAAQLVKRGHISRMKIPGQTFYRYFLSPDQHAMYTARAHYKVADVLNKAGNVVAIEGEPTELHARLAFLRMLKEKTVYSEHAALAGIIRDYELALKRAAQAEDDADVRAAKALRLPKPGRVSKRAAGAGRMGIDSGVGRHDHAIAAHGSGARPDVAGLQVQPGHH